MAKRAKADSVQNLPDLMEQIFGEGKVVMCFCTLCSHDPEYGHCYACPCGNHQPTPVSVNAEETKLQNTVSHLIRLLKAQADTHRKRGG